MKIRFWLMACCLVAAHSAGAVELYKLGLAGTAKLGGFAVLPQGGDLGEENTTVGADLVYQVADFFSLEFSLFQLEDRIDLAASDTGIEVTGNQKLETLCAAFSARAEWNMLRRFGVYGGGGLGYYYIEPDEHGTVTAADPYDDVGASTHFDSEIDSTFGYHLLAGVHFLILYNAELFADYRWTYLDADLDTEATVTSAEGERLAEINDTIPGYDHGLWRVGLNVYFQACKEMVDAAACPPTCPP